MIYTSYFANIRKIRKGRKLISISQITPHWAEVDGEFKSLAPNKSILFDIKQGKIGEEEYTERYYNEVLSKLNPEEVYRKLNNSILFCYEKRGDFCHRHIVSDWFHKNGL